MSRAKKDATVALKDLGHYLRRDAGASKKVDAVSRYVGELRQAQSTMKTHIGVLEKQIDSLQDRISSLETQLACAKAELEREQSQHAQARRNATAAQAKAAELAAELDPPDPVLDGLSDGGSYLGIAKKLRRRMKWPPRPFARAYIQKTSIDPTGIVQSEAKKAVDAAGMSHAEASKIVARKIDQEIEKMLPDRIAVLKLTDVITDYRADQFETLGMFVTMMTLFGWPVSFLHSVHWREFGHEATDKQKAQIAYWLRNWYGYSLEEDAAFMAMKEKIQKKCGGNLCFSHMPSGRTGDKSLPVH